MMDSVRVAGQPPVTDTVAKKATTETAKPVETAKPPIACDSVAVTKKAGGVPAVNLIDEEPNRKQGVTFKNMLKAANAAADQGFTDQATPLYDRAINLAEDSGDLEKVIKAANDQAYLPVVKRALAKGLQIAKKIGDLEDLAKLADKRGLRPETEKLVSKAIDTCNNAKELRKLAEFAADHKLQSHAQQAFAKIATLPAK